MDSDRESLLEYLGRSRCPSLSRSLCFHASDLGNLPIIISYPITPLCYLCIYISYGRIRYCHVVYMVPCLGDHLCSGAKCGDCAEPSEIISLWWQGKVLHIAIDEESGALSMHVVPPAIWIVVVPARVAVMLGPRNPPCSWIDTVCPSLLGFTVAPCVHSLLCYRIDQTA
jgi:hypothetical protein